MEALDWWKEVDFIPQQDKVLARGDSGPRVAEYQQLLREAGFPTEVDGDFGPGTERALRLFQKAAGLVADGRLGPKTEWRLRQHPKDPKVLTQEDLSQAADALSVNLAAVMAVNEVESRGSGFFSSGRAAILFERHIMWRRLKAANINPTPFHAAMPNVVNRNTGGYKGGEEEYHRLENAQSIHPDIALESASWGAFQLMGYHWERLGYVSVQDFVERMQTSEAEHLDGFVRFVKADTTLHTALRAEDWPTFARHYNGPAYAKNAYDVKLARAFAHHSSVVDGLYA